MFNIINTCLLALTSTTIFCLKVNFERTQLVSWNPKYVSYAFTNVTRRGRRSGNYINIEFITKYICANNITVNILFYELRRNEYRRSFIEFHYKLCDLFEKDPYIGKIAANTGIKCPIKAEKYSITIPAEPLVDFPSVFPFENGRINFCFNSTSSGESLAEGELFLSFKNEVKGGKQG